MKVVRPSRWQQTTRKRAAKAAGIALVTLVIMTTKSVYWEENENNNVVQSLQSEVNETLINISGDDSLSQTRPRYVDFYTEDIYQHDLSTLNKTALEQDCIQTYKHKVTVCLHPKATDIISDTLRQTGGWEPDLSSMLFRVLELFPASRSAFLDVGANLGVHSLSLGSMMGRRSIWAVEPTLNNVVRLETARRKVGIQNMKVIRNAVSDRRRPLFMHLLKGNFGGSQVSAALPVANYTDVSSSSVVKSVLLSDVIDAMLDDRDENAEGKLDIVMKIDIEGFECRAVLGSENSFLPNPSYSIPFIVMEWRFESDFKNLCPLLMQQRMVNLFTAAGYVPFRILPRKRTFSKKKTVAQLNSGRFGVLDPAQVEKWPLMDMVWVLEEQKQRIIQKLEDPAKSKLKDK